MSYAKIGADSYNRINRYHDIMENITCLDSMGDGTTFRIPNTDLYLFLFTDGCRWYLFPDKSFNPIMVTFDYILEKVNDEVKTNLLFNLDILSREALFEPMDPPITRYTISGFKGL